MVFSTRGRYGLRAMLELARHFDRKKVLAKDIAQAHDISKKYLERILFTLKHAGLVKSRRGTKGGYTLAKGPAQIKLIQIINALEGSLSPVECLDDPAACKFINTCVVRHVWKKIKEAIEEILGSITLEDLVNQYPEINP